ncbi:hypothetical protein H0H92_013737 [Tricholoma furcatifolium]|nr:hypothetical protein H0H92_013737 [Tricholoma furcatifolium]
MKSSHVFFAFFFCLSVYAAPAPRVSPSQDADSYTNNSISVAAAWYPSWSSIALSDIPWSKYNVMSYSFAFVLDLKATTNDTDMISLNSSMIPQFVSLARNNSVKALISVGGWFGSEYFSSLVAPANRANFVSACKYLVGNYSLDGLDFDWEFPNELGVGNLYSPSDASNYIAFLSDLRAELGPEAFITLSVSTSPFLGSNNQSMPDVSSLAEPISYIAIMNYDIYGPFSSTTGPNAPLNLTCSSYSEARSNPSATSAIQAWIDAQMPASQIVLGVPSYGHTYSVPSSQALSNNNTISLYSNFSGSGTKSGQYTFAQMVSLGYLSESGAASTASNISYFFDNCSQTPFVYSNTSQILISYDNAESFSDKGKFITDHGLLGFAMYDVTGDYDNILVDAITSAM